MIYVTLLTATLAATTLMTAFSYFVSYIFKEPYKEPLLLSILLHPTDQSLLNRFIGWMIHYLIGLLFVVIYYLLLNVSWIDANWMSGTIYGLLIGFVGVVSWHYIFKIPSRTVKLNHKAYYLQLVIAHLIFGITMVCCFKAMHFVEAV